MKKMIYGILGMTLLGSAYAGLPSEDPIVSRIADEFEHGTKPTEEDLKIRWTKCVQFMASRGNFRFFENGVGERAIEFSFEKFDGSYWKIENSEKYLTGNSREIFGKWGDAHNEINTFRISSTGAMIAEWAIEGDDWVVSKSRGGGAIEAPARGEYASQRGAKAASYTLCERNPGDSAFGSVR